MVNALLIVDVQKYFMKDAPTDLPRRIANHIESVRYDCVAFTVFKNAADSNFVRSLKWDKCGSDEDTRLPDAFDAFVTQENTFSRANYSAFKSTDLDAFLKGKKVDRLVICGVDTDACVLATAYEAFDLGYHVKVNFDLCFSSNDLQDNARLIAEKNIHSRD